MLKGVFLATEPPGKSQRGISLLVDDVNPFPPGLMLGSPRSPALGSHTIVSCWFYLCLTDYDLVIRMEQYPSCLLHSRKRESPSLRQWSHWGHLQRPQEQPAPSSGLQASLLVKEVVINLNTALCFLFLGPTSFYLSHVFLPPF